MPKPRGGNGLTRTFWDNDRQWPPSWDTLFFGRLVIGCSCSEKLLLAIHCTFVMLGHNPVKVDSRGSSAAVEVDWPPPGAWAPLLRRFRRDWEKLIMEIQPKQKKYINNTRVFFPQITYLDEPLQLDSLGLLRLVAFLENELGYRIEDEELIADNFATLRSMRDLLATKTPT